VNWAAVAIALFLAVFPLLPAGPGYFGISASYSVDVAVGVLLLVWIGQRLSGGRRVTGDTTPGRAVLYAWLVLIVAMTGALFVALALETRRGSPVLAEQLAGLPWRILQPHDFIDDPFYPARIWLTFLEGFLAFAIIRGCCRRAESPQRFATIATWGLLGGLAVVSTVAIVQYLTHVQLHPLWVMRNPGLVRAHATLDDPNALGSYLVLCVGLAIGVALSGRRRSVAVVVAVLALAALLTTASRAALIAFPAAALFVIAFAPRPSVVSQPARTMARGIFAAAIAVGFVLLAARLVVEEQPASLPTNPVEAVAQTFDPRMSPNEVFRDRLALWRAAREIARWHPIAGIGLARYPREAPNFLTQWIPFENTHNFFLQLLAEAGFVGMLSFIALVAVAIRSLWRASAGDHEDGGLAWGGLIGVLAFSLTCLTGHPLLAPSGQIMFGSVLALTLAGVELHRMPASSGSRLIPALAVAASLVAASVYGVTASRMPSPPWLGDPWGYSWGLFPEERGFFPTAWDLPVPSGDLAPGPPGTRPAVFKWTGPRALLEMEVRTDARECVLPFAASLPSQVKGGQQSITFRYGNTQRTLDIANSDLQSVQIPFTPEMLDRGRWLLIRIEVSPPFVPARVTSSTDQRELGIMLFLPRCQ